MSGLARSASQARRIAQSYSPLFNFAVAATACRGEACFAQEVRFAQYDHAPPRPAKHRAPTYLLDAPIPLTRSWFGAVARLSRAGCAHVASRRAPHDVEACLMLQSRLH